MSGGEVVTWSEALLFLAEACIVGFTLLYAVSNSILILIGFNPARARVRELGYNALDLMDVDERCPPVAVLAPAYNEEMGIVESVRAFLALEYPRLEIVVINDGSKDGTLAVLREAFGLVRRDVTLRGDLETAAVRAVYEPAGALPETVQRFIVVDKENGGRADALNAGINACRSPYFITIDADSILDPTALKLTMRLFEDDPETMAAGGQIGVVNDCTVENGRITKMRMPRSYLALCQTLEYLRSFATARTGFSRLNCLMILSGAFLLIRRDKAREIGGFLTGRVKSKLLHEYAGPGKHTMGEDMELITRLHRYERERGGRAKVVHSPVPVCWTEVPPTWQILSRQRRRWHRGFMEIMRYHGKMILNPDYGRVGLVSMPFLALFEGLGPYLEALGYLLLPILTFFGLIDFGRAALLFFVALGFGVLHSTISVLCGTWLEPVSPTGSRVRSLMGMDSWRDRLLLLAGCILGECGYRQMTVWWRMRGTWEYIRGTGGWGEMKRTGFKGAAAALAAFLVLGVPVPASGEAFRAGTVREAQIVAGTEHRSGADTGWWTEATARWLFDPGSPAWRGGVRVGGYRFDRAAGSDEGILLVWEARPREGAGGALELRVAPGAAVSPRWSLHLEAEALVRRPFTLTGIVRYSRFADLSVIDFAPGSVAYLPRDAWVALRGNVTRTDFAGGESDDIRGWSAVASFRAGAVEVRVSGGSGAESYLAGAAREARQIRARFAGATMFVPVTAGSRVEVGVARRFPERGADDLYVHAGLKRRW